MPHYYLPDTKHLNTAQWSYNELLPSVQNLVKKNTYEL